MNNLELKPIEELLGMSFYIPAYQRGYRWTSRQVEDLMDDIAEFISNGARGIYCIQPLVVVKREHKDVMQQIKKANDLESVKRLLKGRWEVVDGQQRLTTIKLILSVLQNDSYDIEYETRESSASFLAELNPNSIESNIDYYYIWNAYQTIQTWVKAHHEIDILNALLKQVKFIWYESNDVNPKEVFTRLNIGKISLTNAELVKALILNKTNFNSDLRDDNHIKAIQQEIAMQWDVIEYSLQSKEFWLFLNNLGNDRPTRIELVFYMIAKNDMLGCGYDEGVNDKDEYYTFRYFNRFMLIEYNKHRFKSDIIKDVWNEVMEIYLTFREWYEDLELYHYIGFLICCKPAGYLYKLFKNWNECSSKSEFRCSYLVKEIKSCLNITNLESTVYDVGGNGGQKTNCRSILLLHNVQRVINQNRVLTQNEKYNVGLFYKFPFHLYKIEGWDIEHIDSNTENQLNDIRTQREWLLSAYFGLNGIDHDKIKNLIVEFFQKYHEKKDKNGELKAERDKDFSFIYSRIEDSDRFVAKRLSQEEKNMIWNFTLLDASTNRSYGNAIYPAKRRVIIGKEQGKKYDPPTIDENGNIIPGAEVEGMSSFIPPCTKYVFMKYFDTSAFNPNVWSIDDAKAYLKDLMENLKQFMS